MDIRHEQAIQAQDSSLRELQEVVHGRKRLERGKDPSLGDGELYSPSDTSLMFGN